jgi:2-methylcitrate dehydratase PrpD
MTPLELASDPDRAKWVPGPRSGHVATFIHGLHFAAAPAEVQRETRICLLDTLGIALAGTELPIARIIRRFVARHLGIGEGGGARMIRDGRRVSVPGAAMAGAAIIDGFDGHDGHALCKGHAGVTVVPAALAFADALRSDDREEFLTLVLLGYEIGTRAGIALHATSPTMHSSGAWNALAAAAIGSRALRLSHGQTAHALGIAEYYGPRSRLMRVIEHPTMVKDGSTMGAFAGVSAAYLAEDGYTGAPADTIELEGLPASVVPAADTRDPSVWSDLGTRWRILEQYRKPDPVCRWTQPAAEAIFSLRSALPGMTHADVTDVVVETFHEAVSLSCREPTETDAAQYSLPFVVGAAIVHGRLTAAELAGAGLHDDAVLRLSRAVKLVERGEFNARFPAERWASVRLTLRDGTILDSGPHTTRGDPATPLSLRALSEKFRTNALGALDERTVQQIADWILDSKSGGELSAFLDLVLT